MAKLGAFLLAGLLLLFGYVIAVAGYDALRKWSSISAGFASYGLLWFAAGPAMLIAGLWALASLGRASIPLRVGGIAAMVAGASLIAGVLTYVVPCSGPD
jgi:hypothetical protein